MIPKKKNVLTQNEYSTSLLYRVNYIATFIQSGKRARSYIMSPDFRTRILLTIF
jgi:hypothetical protein